MEKNNLRPLKVILSCKTLEQLAVAERYAELWIRAAEVELLESLVDV